MTGWTAAKTEDIFYYQLLYSSASQSTDFVTDNFKTFCYQEIFFFFKVLESK